MVAVNSCLTDVGCNEAKMKEGLLQDKECVEMCVSKIKSVTNILSKKIAIEGHIARVIDALSSVKWALDILTGCTVNVRKGIL
jgi:hypothetical protein